MTTARKHHWQRLKSPVLGLALLIVPTAASSQGFRVEEASITDIQHAISSGETSCRRVVQAYLDRAKAYNGVCTALVTKDGAPIAPATGMMRAGSLLRYPTQTVAASLVFPESDQYSGPPLEFGRMTTSASDPSVQLQYGLRVGIPVAGQLNALETLNIRGERSVTCKGDFDRAPSAGPLPPNAPAICEEFHKQPDALERAEQLDKEYGRKPDLTKLPLYCSVMAIKNWYDTKDMRGTGGNDVDFAMDVPKADSPDVASLRSKGAVIYAVASAENVGGPAAAGASRSKLSFPAGDLQYSPWSGHACNPYDTARTPRGSSNGSAVSVSANLTTCSICEQTSGSCKGPASRNGVVNLLTTKGILEGGGWSTNIGDRAGIQCKSLKDATVILDAIKGYNKLDSFSALPKGTIPDNPYESSLVSDAKVLSRPLKGVRVAVVREFMVKQTKNDATISDQIDREIKEILRDKLGAELVESVDPLYPDDPSVPNMTYTFADAFAEILPHVIPEFFLQKSSTGELAYAVPGWDVTSLEYAVALQLHKAPLSPLINLRSIGLLRYANPSGLLDINTYLAARNDARVKDWESFIVHASFKSDEARLRAQDALEQKQIRPSAGTLNYLQMQSVMRLVVLKVMQENHIDVFVNPEQTTPPYLLGGAIEPEVNGRPSRSCCQILTALIGAPEVEIPAGFTTVTYDPKTVLSPDRKEYTYKTGEVRTVLTHPMPISMMFWSGPGYDADVIRVASAYESATHHRRPPAAFGPLVPGAPKQAISIHVK